MKKKFIFLVSHPIQYFSPLFQQMAQEPEIDLLVLYCSDENIKGHIDKGFGVNVEWDIPLLEGYNYKFLKNNSWKPSIKKGFFGLINIELLRLLKNERGSILIVQGWGYFTHLMAIIFGRAFGLTICVRGDNPLNQEVMKSKMLIVIKRILLGNILFKFVHYFLYVGKQNKEFYKYYGVPEKKLIFTPHAVDNDRFKKEYKEYKNNLITIKNEIGLPTDKKIILFSGKYISQKRPMDLLKAFHLLNDENIGLVFLGEGELRNQMEEYIRKHNLENVYLTGFKNQSEVGKYFAAADIFVLPSGAGETWGLVVNEALNFSLPVVVSNQVGCIDDLVINNENGFIFECGNLEELTNTIKILFAKDLKLFGRCSRKLIEPYSFENIIRALKTNFIQ